MTITTIPEKFNIGKAITTLTQNNTGQTFTIINEDESIQRIERGQLFEQSNRAAAMFAAHNLKLQSRIIILLPNVIDFPVVFAGILKAGLIAVPLSYLLVPEELDHLIDDCEASAIITTSEKWHQLKNSLSSSASYKNLIAFITDPGHQDTETINLHKKIKEYEPENIPVTTAANDPAYLVYTSGSTGYPKGVLHAHRALPGKQPAMRHWLQYHKYRRMFHTGQLNWTYVLGTGFMDALYSDIDIFLYNGPHDPEKYFKIIQDHDIELLISVPAIYRQLLHRTRFSGKTAPSLKHATSAGESLPANIWQQFKDKFGFAIYEGMGMSECSYYISHREDLPPVPGTVGGIQPGHKAEILDKNMQPVQPEHEGVICIHKEDPGLFLGYFNDKETTAKMFQQDWFVTGDHARYDNNGYIHFMGRRDDIINAMGYRISPLEIERVIKGHEAVLECVAYGKKINNEKTLVALQVVLKDKFKQLEPDPMTNDIKAYATQHLARYKQPKIITFVETLKRTRTGKIDRKNLIKI